MSEYLTLVFRADDLDLDMRSGLAQMARAMSWSHAIDDRKAVEQERDQLKVALEIVTHELESWKATEEDPDSILAIQIGKQAINGCKGLSLAEHDAEVIEKACRAAMPGPGFPPDDPPKGLQEYCEGIAEVMEYAKQLRQKAQEPES